MKTFTVSLELELTHQVSGTHPPTHFFDRINFFLFFPHLMISQDYLERLLVKYEYPKNQIALMIQLPKNK